MKKTWNLYELSKIIGTTETPYHLSDGVFFFRNFPFYACSVDSKPPPSTKIINTWEDYDISRLAILGGIDWATSESAHVYQLSLHLLSSHYKKNDPLNSVILKLVKRNKIFVVAAGNGGPNQGTLNDLACIRGVISVGATTPKGKLLKTSSRGNPDGCFPTLACEGTDPWPDPFPPGTSFAAARIAEVCVFLRSVFAWLASEFYSRKNQTPFPPGMAERSRLAILDTSFNKEEIVARQNATGTTLAVVDGESYLEYAFGFHRSNWIDTILEKLPPIGMHFQIDNSPESIRRVLQEEADSSICSDITGCGAGFLPVSGQNGIFTKLTKLTPSRFYKWFGDISPLPNDQRYLLDELDHELGPIWNAETVQFLLWEYLNRAYRIYARVF